MIDQSIMLGCASKPEKSVATPLHGARIRFRATGYRTECRCPPDQFSFGTAKPRRREGAKSLRLITFEVASEPTLIGTVAEVFCKLLRIDSDYFRRGSVLHISRSNKLLPLSLSSFSVICYPMPGPRARERPAITASTFSTQGRIFFP